MSIDTVEFKDDPVIRDIPGYEDRYQISEHGEVYNKITGRTLSQQNCAGYPSVKLYKDSAYKRYKTHRILAIVFIPNEDSKPVVDHINGVTSDNRLNNLRWATIYENCANTVLSKRNTSGVKGVSVGSDRGKKFWRCMIKFNRKEVTKAFPFTDDGFLKAVEWRKQKEREYGYLSH